MYFLANSSRQYAVVWRAASPRTMPTHEASSSSLPLIRVHKAICRDHRLHVTWHNRNSRSDKACVCVCIHTLMLSTARWQHAARTEQPSWKYHSASSLQTLCSRLDRENSRRSEVRVLRWRRGGTACLLPLVLYGVHVVSCVVDRGGLRGTNVSFTCSLKKTIFSLLYSSLNLTKRYLIYCKKKKRLYNVSLSSPDLQNLLNVQIHVNVETWLQLTTVKNKNKIK